ncbi:hypothetical protein V8G54_035763, partial [Vigna mungo]
PRLSLEEPRSNTGNLRESPTGSASSREIWPAAAAIKRESDCPDQAVIRRVSGSDKITLHDVARERVDIICEKMSRSDLTTNTLARTHRVQLEILVAINTGIQGFLHPSINLSQASLIEIFLYKRCRNLACGSQLPAEDCTCETCTNGNGFCNLCIMEQGQAKWYLSVKHAIGLQNCWVGLKMSFSIVRCHGMERP